MFLLRDRSVFDIKKNELSEFRSNLMGKIKGKNTKLEKSVSKALWNNGFRFRKNVLSLYGKPDIAIKNSK
ncbi:hypothetical protein [Paenibacillus spongiae]|uniref:hypothetical protein n=1 Tax=Paenibacillus spongiae TaxID=2909671 RepID=UPI00283A9EC2|nr:hypothetical protein [Paenibacillus spongiae]